MKATLLLCLIAITTSSVNIFDASSITPEVLIQLRNAQLKKINEYRSLHGVGPLFINSTLNDIAQNYSKYLYENDMFNHSSPAYQGNYGQNLFRRGSIPYMTYYQGDATKMWEDQEQYYDYSTHRSKDPNDPAKMVWHFTSQMWKNVQSVGFGFTAGPRVRMVSSQDANIVQLYVVANYFPTPNIIGLFDKNVFPPL